MAVAELFLASTLPVLKVVLLGSIGVVLARCGVLTSEGRHVLSKLNFTVFTPALTFSKLAPAITLQHLHLWLPIPLNMIISVAVGLALGQLVNVVTRAPASFRPHVIAATGLGNAGNLPLVLVAAIAREAQGTLQQGGNVEDLAVAYVALGILVATLTHFSMGQRLLQPTSDQAQLPQQQIPGQAVAGEAVAGPGQLMDRLVKVVSMGKQKHQGAGYSRLESGAASPEDRLAVAKEASDAVPAHISSTQAAEAHAVASERARQLSVYVITDHADDADAEVAAIHTTHQRPEHEQHAHNSITVEGQRHGTSGNADGEEQQQHHQQQQQQQQQRQPQQQQQEGAHREGYREAHSDQEPLMGGPGHQQLPSSFFIAAHELPGSLHGESYAGTLLGQATRGLAALRRGGAAVLGFVNPPLLGTLVSLVVGTVPPLRNLFFGQDGALRLVQDCIDMMGQCCIPALMLMVGATLEKGPGAGKLPWKVVAGVAGSRLVLLPLLGTAWIMAAFVTGLFKAPDPIFLIVMLLQNSVPTALNVQTMCVMWNSHPLEMSQVIFWSYLLCIVTLPPFLFLYMYLGQAYFPAGRQD